MNNYEWISSVVFQGVGGIFRLDFLCKSDWIFEFYGENDVKIMSWFHSGDKNSPSNRVSKVQLMTDYCSRSLNLNIPYVP